MDLLGIKLALQGMFAELGKKTSNTTNGGVPLLNTQTGEPNGMIAMSDLANVLEAQHSFTCGLTIASYDGDYLRFRRLDQAASYKSTAVGIGIFEAGHLLIVAKDETQAKWSEERVSGGTAACGREAALIDTHGREKTQTIVDRKSVV